MGGALRRRRRPARPRDGRADGADGRRRGQRAGDARPHGAPRGPRRDRVGGDRGLRRGLLGGAGRPVHGLRPGVAAHRCPDRPRTSPRPGVASGWRPRPASPSPTRPPRRTGPPRPGCLGSVFPSHAGRGRPGGGCGRGFFWEGICVYDPRHGRVVRPRARPRPPGVAVVADRLRGCHRRPLGVGGDRGRARPDRSRVGPRPPRAPRRRPADGVPRRDVAGGRRLGRDLRSGRLPRHGWRGRAARRGRRVSTPAPWTARPTTRSWRRPTARSGSGPTPGSTAWSPRRGGSPGSGRRRACRRGPSTAPWRTPTGGSGRARTGGLARLDRGARRFVVYDAEDGLPFTEFAFTAAHRLRSGALLFGGVRGVRRRRAEPAGGAAAGARRSC